MITLFRSVCVILRSTKLFLRNFIRNIVILQTQLTVLVLKNLRNFTAKNDVANTLIKVNHEYIIRYGIRSHRFTELELREYPVESAKCPRAIVSSPPIDTSPRRYDDVLYELQLWSISFMVLPVHSGCSINVCTQFDQANR